MSDEWGPWIEHDGKGCPVPNGTIIHAIDMGRGGDLGEHVVAVVAADLPESSWTMADEFGRYRKCIRYRVRKPLGLSILEGCLESLPEKSEIFEAEAVPLG